MEGCNRDFACYASGTGSSYSFSPCLAGSIVQFAWLIPLFFLSLVTAHLAGLIFPASKFGLLIQEEIRPLGFVTFSFCMICYYRCLCGTIPNSCVVIALSKNFMNNYLEHFTTQFGQYSACLRQFWHARRVWASFVKIFPPVHLLALKLGKLVRYKKGEHVMIP